MSSWFYWDLLHIWDISPLYWYFPHFINIVYLYFCLDYLTKSWVTVPLKQSKFHEHHFLFSCLVWNKALWTHTFHSSYFTSAWLIAPAHLIIPIIKLLLGITSFLHSVAHKISPQGFVSDSPKPKDRQKHGSQRF